MTNKLTVIKPFYVMEVGDTFELSQDGKAYVSKIKDEFYGESDKQYSTSAIYESSYTISLEYARELVSGGFLKQDDSTEKPKFTNVFDEIDTLIGKYQIELTKETNNAELKEVNVEKVTVLSNMIKLLNHLKSLKK